MSNYAKHGRMPRKIGDPSSKYGLEPEQFEKDIEEKLLSIEAAREGFKMSLHYWAEDHGKRLSQEQLKDIVVGVLLDKYKREGLVST